MSHAHEEDYEWQCELYRKVSSEELNVFHIYEIAAQS